MINYTVADWQLQLKNAEATNSREWLYRFLRPFWNLQTRRYLHKQTLERFRPDLVLPERGFPIIARRLWGSAHHALTGKVILVQGAGNGWDVASWAKLKPKTIYAADMFTFDSWNEVRKYAEQEYGVEVKFSTSPLDQLGFLGDQSIDLCASDAVFEHVKNLEQVLLETNRVLKPGGLVYATYGPMWYCAEGDHFGRGDLRDVFNHLLLDQEKYRLFLKRYTLPQENFQAGVRYVELDLFSRLRTEDYLTFYRRCGFRIDSLILEVSRRATNFKRLYPETFEELKRRYPNCNEDDFLIKANFVRLRK